MSLREIFQGMLKSFEKMLSSFCENVKTNASDKGFSGYGVFSLDEIPNRVLVLFCNYVYVTDSTFKIVISVGLGKTTIPLSKDERDEWEMISKYLACFGDYVCLETDTDLAIGTMLEIDLNHDYVENLANAIIMLKNFCKQRWLTDFIKKLKPLF